MNLKTVLASLCLAVCGSTIAAPIQPVTWVFEGYVNGLGLPGGQCYEQGCQDLIDAKASFTGRITFDLLAPDLDPTASGGLYRSYGEPFGLHIDIGAYSYDTSYVQTGISQGLSFDQYTFLMDEQGQWFSRVGIFSMWVFADNVLTSDAQLSVPPGTWRGGFDPQFITTAGGADLDLRITKMEALRNGHAVPEPGTWTLAALGLALVGWQARRRELRKACVAQC